MGNHLKIISKKMGEESKMEISAQDRSDLVSKHNETGLDGSFIVVKTDTKHGKLPDKNVAKPENIELTPLNKSITKLKVIVDPKEEEERIKEKLRKEIAERHKK